MRVRSLFGFLLICAVSSVYAGTLNAKLKGNVIYGEESVQLPTDKGNVSIYAGSISGKGQKQLDALKKGQCIQISAGDTTFAKSHGFISIDDFRSVKVVDCVPAVSTPSDAKKTVKCAIESAGSPAFRGSCLFRREKGGSFSLASAQKGKNLFPEITDVSVYIVAKDVAEVRGLTIYGNNSRWGEARRSTKDRACWVGQDFRICAW